VGGGGWQKCYGEEGGFVYEILPIVLYTAVILSSRPPRQCLWAILCLRGTSSAFALTMMPPCGTYLAFGRPSNTSIILSRSLWSLVQLNSGPSPVDDASLICVLPFKHSAIARTKTRDLDRSESTSGPTQYTKHDDIAWQICM